MGNITLTKFQKIIKAASQPVKESKKKVVREKSNDYSGKKTRLRKSANTLGKQRDMSR